MVDVHSGVGAPAQRHHIQEVLERPLLVGKGMRPQRRVLLVVVDPAEQVVDAPHRSHPVGGFGVERVSLEVEEEVAAVGPGQRSDRLRKDHLEGRHRRRGRGCRLPHAARRAVQLQARLRTQAGERVTRHPLGRRARDGQVVDGMDAGGAQPVTLHGSHPGDEQQVAMGDDLRIAGRASAARHDPELTPVVSPRDRSARGARRDVAVGDERPQSLPAQPEDG